MTQLTSENSSQATGKPSNILHKWNGYADIFSSSQDLEISRQYFFLLTDILKKSRWVPLTDGWVENEALRPKNEDPPQNHLKIARNGYLDLRCVRNNKIFNYQ